MKQLIRKGVFETNSSSSHSIALATEDKQFILDTIYPDQNGVVRISGDEFGWDWFKNNDAETKASYAAQSFANDDNMLETLSEVIKEQTGATEVIYEGLNDGYIDHDSYGIVPTSSSDLKNFIFNKNSWLFGGNDNSEPDPTFYHVPEIRDGKIILPTYKYELKINGLDRTTKFLDKPSDEELENGIDAILRDTVLTEDGTFFDDDNILFKISRDRDRFYEKSYRVKQDYSTGEIRFSKEGGNKFFEITNDLKESGLLEGLDWEKREELITERALEIPGLVIKVKFTITEI